MLEANPVVEAEFEDINTAIRKERARLWDMEDQGFEPRYTWLEYLEFEKKRGVQQIVTNY